MTSETGEQNTQPKNDIKINSACAGLLCEPVYSYIGYSYLCRQYTREYKLYLVIAKLTMFKLNILKHTFYTLCTLKLIKREYNNFVQIFVTGKVQCVK